MGSFDAPLTNAISLTLQVLLYLGALTFAGTTIFEVSIAGRPVAGLQRVTLAAGALAVTASTLLLPFGALVILGVEPPALLDPAGWAPLVLWPTIACALVVWVGVASAFLTTPPGRPATGWTALFAALVAVAPVLTGHSATLDPGVLRLVDAAHLLAASVWAGGLVGLLLVLLPHRGGDTPGDPVEAAHTLDRFSQWAAGTVLVLGTSGVALAISSLDRFDSLWLTGYGRLLTLKLALAAVVLGIAGLNRWRVVPAIERDAEHASAWRTLRRHTAAEAALLVAVVVVTGALTNSHAGHVGH